MSKHLIASVGLQGPPVNPRCVGSSAISDGNGPPDAASGDIVSGRELIVVPLADVTGASCWDTGLAAWFVTRVEDWGPAVVEIPIGDVYNLARATADITDAVAPSHYELYVARDGELIGANTHVAAPGMQRTFSGGNTWLAMPDAETLRIWTYLGGSGHAETQYDALDRPMGYTLVVDTPAVLGVADFGLTAHARGGWTPVSTVSELLAVSKDGQVLLGQSVDPMTSTVTQYYSEDSGDTWQAIRTPAPMRDGARWFGALTEEA